MISEHTAQSTTYIVGGIVLVVMGLLALWLRGPGLLDQFLVAGILLVPTGIGVALWAAMLSGGSVSCHEKGLLLRRGQKQEAVFWPEIDTINQKITRNYSGGVHVSTTHVYDLTCSNGKKFKLNDIYEDVEVVGERIQAEVCRAKLPGILAEFRAGRPVKFGDLTFDAQGISRGKTSILWSEFKTIDFKDGFLRVHKPNEGVKGLIKGGTIVLSVANVPNFYTMLMFMQQLPNYQESSLD